MEIQPVPRLYTYDILDESIIVVRTAPERPLRIDPKRIGFIFQD